MALHLIKLCVGCDSVEDLRRWRRGRAGPPVCHTRQTPKRAAEVADGGSLFWVFKGSVLCRSPVAEIRTIGEGPASRCEIVLKPDLILVEPVGRRPFQGWRYLTAADAPGDLTASNDDGGLLPSDVAVRLRELGAW